MTQHTLHVSIPYYWPIGNGERESSRPTVRLTYDYQPGFAGCGPRYSHGGIQPDPPDLVLRDVDVLETDGTVPRDIEGWVEDWLFDEGFDLACEHAELERGQLVAANDP